MRIKCPSCGSTAQVEMMWEDTDKYDYKFSREYECECGCKFELTFQANNLIILPNEKPKGHIHCPCNGTDCSYWEKGVCSLYSEKEGWLDPIDECEDFAYFWTEYDDYIDYD